MLKARQLVFDCKIAGFCNQVILIHHLHLVNYFINGSVCVRHEFDKFIFVSFRCISSHRLNFQDYQVGFSFSIFQLSGCFALLRFT